MKGKGWTIGGAIGDDYMYLIPPRKPGHYAIRGKDGIYPVYIPLGQIPPKEYLRSESEED